MVMRCMPLCLLVFLGLALLHSQAVASGIPVVDAALNSQAVIQVANQIKAYAAMIKQLQNEAAQIQNQIQQIQHAATTVQHGAQNLVQLKVSNLQDVLGLMDQLEGKLAQAQAIHNTVGQSVSDVQRLYPRMVGQVDAGQQRTLALQWAAAQRDAATVAVRTQAMQDTQKAYRREWNEVLTAAKAAKGNLEIEQANAEALGLVGTQLAGIEAQLATAARQQSQRDLREASMMEAEATAAVANGRAVNPDLYTPDGHALAMPQTR